MPHTGLTHRQAPRAGSSTEGDVNSPYEHAVALAKGVEMKICPRNGACRLYIRLTWQDWHHISPSVAQFAQVGRCLGPRQLAQVCPVSGQEMPVPVREHNKATGYKTGFCCRRPGGPDCAYIYGGRALSRRHVTRYVNIQVFIVLSHTHTHTHVTRQIALPTFNHLPWLRFNLSSCAMSPFSLQTGLLFYNDYANPEQFSGRAILNI